MNKVLRLAFLCTLPLALVRVAGANESLHTDCKVLVGRPDPAKQKGSVQVMPWSVVVGEGVAERYAADLGRVIERLRSAYRLGELRLADSSAHRMSVGDEARVSSPSPALDIRIKLLAVDSEKALYQVKLTDGGKLKADPKITIARGGRAIIGGQDGEQAPYVFLVVEPAGSAGVPATGEGVIPKIIEKVEPVYPEDAAAEHVQGLVLLRCVVAKDGSVRSVEPIKSADKRLTDSAIEAVKQWRYTPPTNARGEAVEVEITVTVSFRRD